MGENSSFNQKKCQKSHSQKLTLNRYLDRLKVNPQRANLGNANGKRGFKNSLFRKSDKMQQK